MYTKYIIQKNNVVIMYKKLVTSAKGGSYVIAVSVVCLFVNRIVQNVFSGFS